MALQAFRMAAGLSVRDVARLVYVSSSTVSERENGHRKFPDRKALTDYLNACNADDELIVFCFRHYQRIVELLSTPGQPRSLRYWLGKIYNYGLIFLVGVVVAALRARI
jgi:transcriptional regulator with XRE-family HTH domain